MNGRIYDPVIGRFQSADPYIQDPNNQQSYNRYSYVLNDPLILTDPTGYEAAAAAQDKADKTPAAPVMAIYKSVVSWVEKTFSKMTPASNGTNTSDKGPDLNQSKITGSIVSTTATEAKTKAQAGESRGASGNERASLVEQIPGMSPKAAQTPQTTSDKLLGIGSDILYRAQALPPEAAMLGVVRMAKSLAVTESVATSAAKGAAQNVAKGTTPLFRAVGPAELADINATNALRNLGSAEGKYFTTSAAEASAYAKQAVKAFGDQPYTIIRTDVPNSIFKGLSPATVDRGIPAWVIPRTAFRGWCRE